MSSINRLSGLASGMDTDELIKKLMAANRVPLQKLNQKKQVLQWRQESYRAINNKILELKNLSFDMKLQSNYSVKKSTSTNESIVTTSATSSATPGTYEFEVRRLAQSGRLTSINKIGASSVSTTIGELRSGPDAVDQTMLRISGEKGTATILVNKSDKLSTFMANVNEKAAYTGVRVSYDSNMDRLFFTSTTSGEKSKIELSATNTADSTADTGFLSEVLKLDGINTYSGETVTAGTFFTTPPLAPDPTKLVDATLTDPQKFRVTYRGQSFDFMIDSTATIDQLAGSINASGLKALGIESGLDSEGKFTFKGIANGQKITFTDLTDDGVDVLASLGLPSESSGSFVSGSVTYTKQPADYIDINKKIAPDLPASGDAFKITYDGTDYTFKVTNATSIGTLINQINTSELGQKGVTARLDNTTGELIFTSPDSSKHLSFDDSDNDDSTGVLSGLGLTRGVADGDDFSYDQVKSVGQDAIVVFNGAEGYYANNTMQIAGINFTARSAAVGTTVTVNVSQDVDAVYDKIKAFVDKYNELIETLNGSVIEKRNRDYNPLTDDQRAEMDDNAIEKWEAKAKAGMLYNDSIIKSGLDQFRSAFSDGIAGLPVSQVQSLWQIGISNVNVSGSTLSGSYADRGKIYIDETKLKAAIAEKPNEVMELFNSDDGSSATSSGDGLAVRLYDKATKLFEQITEKAGVKDSVSSTYAIGKDLSNLDKQILRMSERLTDIEDRYYKQFTAMESYLNQMSAQSSWLTQQFSS